MKRLVLIVARRPAHVLWTTLACGLIASAALAGGFGTRPQKPRPPEPSTLDGSQEAAEERAREEADKTKRLFGIWPRKKKADSEPASSEPVLAPDSQPDEDPQPAVESPREEKTRVREGSGYPGTRPKLTPAPGPSTGVPIVTAAPVELWEIDRRTAAPQMGTGGLDPFTALSDDIRAAGLATNDPPLPEGTTVRNGFYFTGDGRVLPECALRISRRDQVQRIEAGRVRPRPYTDEFWVGPEDCSALAWIIRDERDLLIQIDVRDDLLVTVPVEDALTVNDAVEIFLDIRGGDRGTAKYGKGVLHALLAPTRGGVVDVRYGALEQAVSGLHARWRQTPGGYRMMVRVPLQALGWKHGHVASGFSFDLALRDSDSMGALDTLLTWSGTNRNADDARRFGRLRAIRRGAYLDSIPRDGRVPAQAVLRAETRFHVRGGGPGGGTWGAAEDCSAVAWMVRSDKGLLVTIDVTDDIVETSALNPWERDGVELFFDVRPEHDRGKAAHGPGVFQLICAALSEDGAIEPQFGGDPMVTAVEGVTAECRLKRGGYVIEVAVPFSGLKANHVVPGEHFNFDFVVNDADSPSGRDSMLCWSGDGDNWRNASAFGRFEPLRMTGARE